MKISEWLQQGSKDAKTVSPLDKELILCYNRVGIDRLDLIRRADQELSLAQLAAANTMLAQRAAGEPLAYLTGHKEFYGRDFRVTPAVLIPRPETEPLVEWALQLIDSRAWQSVVEVGTGSGAIAVTLKLERPHLRVVASDLSSAALQVARQNGATLGAAVEWLERDLVTGDWPFTPDLVVANLPYVDKNWDWLSPELKFEPAEALYADDAGLALIKKLICQVQERWPRATLLLECDPCQQAVLQAFAEAVGYEAESRGFATLLTPPKAR